VCVGESVSVFSSLGVCLCVFWTVCVCVCMCGFCNVWVCVCVWVL
jgi:hypothetical protein